VCTRLLNYRDPSEPKEKGIDVLLAIDFVMMAMRREYDIGVLCSADTDLVPTLEAVVTLKGEAGYRERHREGVVNPGASIQVVPPSTDACSRSPPTQ
jgi:hypothetical protein